MTPKQKTARTVSRHDPRRIREVLAACASSNLSTAARAHGIDHRTVWRWAHRRDANPGWPTDTDVAAWDAVQADRRARAAELARGRVQQHDYLKRRYVAGGVMKIDPTGTTRRLQALYAIGWNSRDIASRLGCTPARVSHLVSGKWQLVHRHTADQVAAVYDALSMTVPQDPTSLAPGQVRTRERQRRQSAAKGWAPPLAWDDNDIDDPDAQPEGVRGAGYTHGPRSGGHLRDEVADEATVDAILEGEWTLPCSRPTKVAVTARWLELGRALAALERNTGWRTGRYADDARALLAGQDAERDGEAA